MEKTRLDRQVVLKAAMRLLDEAGLEGLTLRRIAQDLGVRAPALYWHFKSKQELLGHLAEEIVRAANPPARPLPGQSWDDWFFQRTCTYRRAMLAHRDSARAVAGNRPTESMFPAMFPAIEEMLGVLCAAGFSPGYAMRCVLNVGAYVGGYVLEEQAEQRREAEEPPVTPEAIERFVEEMAPRYPRLVCAFKEVGDPGGDGGFEHGLRLMIDGMRAHLERAEAEGARG